MNNLIKKIIDVSRDRDAVEKVEQLLEKRLKIEPENVELWLRLAILESHPPLADCEKSIVCLERVFNLDQNNVPALLISAYIHYYQLGGVDKVLFNKLNLLHTPDNELNSMLKYTASWFYAHTEKNITLEEELLKKSIEFYQYHVWNYIHLARFLVDKKRIQEAGKLIEKALENIKKIYLAEGGRGKYDMTDIEEFINERIKGIFLSNQNYAMIIEFREQLKS